jgi:uncharacterized OB-fold protein
MSPTKQTRYIRGKRAAWASAGLCPRCGGVPEPGKTKCQRCLDYQREWMNARRTAAAK